ncbi:MAG: serine protease [Chloroflexota bacterium]|nr:serine protease [Chloroflexota bacterium]
MSPPSEGAAGESLQLEALSSADEGVEDVPGYARPAGALEELWTPPSADLPDVGEASFGPPPPAAETVHGPDDRVQIQNTGDYPWRAHASLFMTAADGSGWIGSGTFIGPRTVLTAGHCVHVKGSGVPGRDGWMRQIQVMPGRNGNTLPFGSKTSSTFRSVTGWTQSGNQEYDYGVIILPATFNNGWFGFISLNDGDLVNTVGNIAGYPGDKPGGTLWYAARKIAAVGPRKVHYDIDTAGGQSGSGVYRFLNNDRHVLGIHAYGGATTNSGTRINGEVFNNLLSWRV